MSWLRGWRPLLRLAWRDALRHRARSALVLTLIALPVLAVTAADVLYQTQRISGAEAIDRRLGTADARITVDPWTRRVLQWPDPDSRYGTAEVAPEGYRPPTLGRLGELLGRPLRGIETASGEVRVTTTRGVATAEGHEVDLTDPLARGLFRITEGRAPVGRGEVVVNQALADRGPGLGELLRIPDGPELRVVGVGESTSTYGEPLLVAQPGALGLPPPAESTHTWLVDAGGPVTWPEVRTLNDLGATVLSRDVLTRPPAADEVPPELRDAASAQTTQNLAVMGLIAAMVLVEVVLLAGPAFAVGARRRSRDLALMAATGATPPQSRRAVLATALVLGLAGAGLGVLGGVGVAVLTQPLVQRLSHQWFGPFDVPWAHLLLVAAFGLSAALLAALVPAWVTSRQDVVAVLAGRRGDRKASLRSPLVGVLLLGLGVAGSAYGTHAQGNGELLIAVAAVIAVLGMVLLVPVALVGVARLSGRLPLVLRFAVRDAARHRTRTAPAVAAVAATVAGVVALGIANASDSAENRATYVATLRIGDGVVQGYQNDSEQWAAIGRVLRRELPSASVTTVSGLREGPVGPSTSLQFRVDGRRDLNWAYGGGLGASVVVADRMLPLPGVDPEQRAAADRMLARGGVVVFVTEPVDGATAIVSGQRYQDGEPAGRVGRRSVPAAVVRVPTRANVPQAMLSPSVARGLRVEPATVAMYVTGATISTAQEQAADEAIGAVVPDTNLYVERGYQPDDTTRIILWILGALGAVLMIGGTLTTTQLALSDARSDLATLGAVGAAPRTRRAVAGSYAMVVALVGGVIGAAVGFVPGIAVTYPLTRSRVDYGPGRVEVSGPFLDIPWLLLGTLVLALPLVTAGLIALTARSRLPMVSRLT